MRQSRWMSGAGAEQESVARDPGVFSVLLAEDDPELRRVLGLVLRGLGWCVWEAANGDEMERYLGCGHDDPADYPLPDLVVSDIRMPGMSGLEVLEALRARCWATPVILITAFGDRDTHAEARRLGATAVLDKPFTVQELRTALAQVAPLDNA